MKTRETENAQNGNGTEQSGVEAGHDPRPVPGGSSSEGGEKGFVEKPEARGGNGVFAKAAAFGKALGKRSSLAEDIYQWEHGVAVEPWPEPVDGRALLEELEAVVRRFVVVGKWVAEAVALWIVHTYAFQLRQVATYVGLESPEKRCGKTTLLTVLCEVVNRPVVASNISSPAFFRVIEESAPTLLIDEADTVLHRNRELRGILNAGYKKKTAYVIRMTPKPQSGPGPCGKAEAEEEEGGEAGGDAAESGLRLGRFSSWCPKAIATIRHLPETLADRCIVVRMHRKSLKESCERLRNLDGTELRRKCARFVADHAKEIADARPALPEDLNDRAADIWEPLLAIADLAGGDWPEKARQAALGLTGDAQEDSPIGSLLLDIMVMLTKEECAPENQWMKAKGGVRVFSRDLVAWLNGCEDRPWMGLRRGKEINERWLSQQLSGYGIRPRTVWIREVSAKGYFGEDFTEAFQRYIPRALALAFVQEQREYMKEKAQREAAKRAEAEARAKTGNGDKGSGL